MCRDQSQMDQQSEYAPQSKQDRQLPIHLESASTNLFDEGDVLESFENDEPSQPGEDGSADPRAVQHHGFPILGSVAHGPSKNTHHHERSNPADHDRQQNRRCHRADFVPMDVLRPSKEQRRPDQFEDKAGRGAHRHPEARESVEEHRVDKVHADVDRQSHLDGQHRGIENPLAGGFYDRTRERGPQQHRDAGHHHRRATTHHPGAEDGIHQVGCIVAAHLDTVPYQHPQPSQGGNAQKRMRHAIVDETRPPSEIRHFRPTDS